jgi:hypothetical protein
MDTISLSLKQCVIKRKQKHLKQKNRESSNKTTRTNAGRARFWPLAGDGRRNEVRRKQNTKSYKSLPVGKKRRDKLQETAKGKLEMPTVKTESNLATSS